MTGEASSAMKHFCVISSVCLFLFLAADVSAWDKQRKGFVLGMSMGPSYVTLTHGRDESEKDFESTGISGKGIIGFAPSNNALVYFTDRVDFFNFEWADTLSDPSAGGGSLGFGMGLTYFVYPEAPSFFLDGGVGIDLIFYDPVKDEFETGLYFEAGVGYEIHPRLAVEFEAIWHDLSESPRTSQTTVTATTYKITFVVLGY